MTKVEGNVDFPWDADHSRLRGPGRLEGAKYLYGLGPHIGEMVEDFNATNGLWVSAYTFGPDRAWLGRLMNYIPAERADDKRRATYNMVSQVVLVPNDEELQQIALFANSITTTFPNLYRITGLWYKECIYDSRRRLAIPAYGIGPDFSKFT